MVAACTAGSVALNFAKYIVVAAVAAFLIYVVIGVPEYRFYAVIAIAIIIIVFFRLWRFIPTEKQYVDKEVRKQLEAMEEARQARTRSRGRGGRRREPVPETTTDETTTDSSTFTPTTCTETASPSLSSVLG